MEEYNAKVCFRCSIHGGKGVCVASIDLTHNPFAVLGVSPRDDRSAIVHAYEEAFVNGRMDEQDLMKAQQVLMASKSRLDAEMSWFLGIAPARVRSIMAILRDEPKDENAQRLLKEIEGLALANLAAHFSVNGCDVLSTLKVLIATQDTYSTELVLGAVNADRAVSGFPKVDYELGEQALRSLRRRHQEVALDGIKSGNHPGKLMTELVETFLKSTGPVHEFLDDLAELYNSWSTPRLMRISEEIDAVAETLRSDPGDKLAIGEIEERLGAWDEYSQPLQLLYEAKALDEPRSRKVHQSLRELCLWLADEQSQYSGALRISKALLDTFPELPSVIKQTSVDIADLEELVEQAKANEIFEGLIAVAKIALEDNVNLIRSIVNQEFAGRKGGLAGDLFREFELVARLAEGTASAAMPWLIVRGLAINLYNDGQIRAEIVLLILEALIKYKDPPAPPQVLESLQKDENTLMREHLIAKATAQNRMGEKLKLLDQAIDLTGDAEETETLQGARNAIHNRIRAQRRKWLIWGGVGVAIIIWAVIDGKGTLLSLSEKKPPEGTSRILSRRELRYCQYQRERLQVITALPLSSAKRSRLTQSVRDWNSRCAQFRYRKRDMSTVNSELNSVRSSLREEALSLVESWR